MAYYECQKERGFQMKPIYSISATHGGQDKVSVPHNQRYNKYIKQAHIDPNGLHETWIHQELSSAYKELFNKARLEYNQSQKEKGRANRQIRDYQKQCRDSKQTNEVYEVIFTIGNRDNHPPQDVCRDVLSDVVDEFKKQNPNFKVVGAYFHADEPGAAPHVHLDYIPFSKGHKRGLSVQNNLSGALKAQGFETTHASDTAQMKWQKEVYNMVEAVCRNHGLDIERGVSKREKRIDTALLKKETKLDELEEQIATQSQLLYFDEQKREKTALEISELSREKNNLTNDVSRLKKEVDLLGDAQERIEFLEKENSRLKRIVKTFQKAFDFVESILKGKTMDVNLEDGSVKKYSSWDWMKNRLFKGLGKQKYDEFQGFRHENQDDKREKVVNRETGFDR